MKDLRDLKIGDFRYLPPDPTFRESRLALEPTETHNLTWNGADGRVTARQPYLTFALKKPTYLCGLRIKYSNQNNGGYIPYFQVRWRDSRRGEKFADHWYHHSQLPVNVREREIPVWIYATVNEIQIIPDIRPCDFSISEVMLLLPDSEASPSQEPATRVNEPALAPGQ